MINEGINDMEDETREKTIKEIQNYYGGCMVPIWLDEKRIDFIEEFLKSYNPNICKKGDTVKNLIEIGDSCGLYRKDGKCADMGLEILYKEETLEGNVEIRKTNGEFLLKKIISID